MTRLAFLLGSLSLLLFHSCDRDRTNPLDPQSILLQVRPAAPEGLTAVSGPGIITLAWLPVTDPDLVGYGLFRATESNGDFKFVSGDGGDAFTTASTSFVDSALSAGDRFYYRVTAVTEEGESEWSIFVTAEARADDLGPAAPAALSATVDDTHLGQVVLTWTAPSRDADGGELTGLESFVVLRRRDGAGALTPVAMLNADSLDTASGSLGSGVVQHTDVGLNTLTTYTYTVVAVDAAGNESDQAASVDVQTAGVAIPTGVSAQGAVRSITISWTASSEPYLIGYNVYRGSRSDGTYTLQNGDGTGFTTGRTSFEDAGLDIGDVFYYRVTAVTSSSESQRSSFVSAEAE